MDEREDQNTEGREDPWSKFLTDMTPEQVEHQRWLNEQGLLSAEQIAANQWQTVTPAPGPPMTDEQVRELRRASWKWFWTPFWVKRRINHEAWAKREALDAIVRAEVERFKREFEDRVIELIELERAEWQREREERKRREGQL
jgi:hypothetical protein